MCGRTATLGHIVSGMTNNSDASPQSTDLSARAERQEDLVWWMTWLGLFVAGAGVIYGLVVALDKEEVECPNGKVFPEGTTDFTCYALPYAPIGLMIAGTAFLLGILVLLGNITARASIEARVALSSTRSGRTD